MILAILYFAILFSISPLLVIQCISYTLAREFLLNSLVELSFPNSSYVLHSVRSGGAAANAGISDRLFKRHGRWKSHRANSPADWCKNCEIYGKSTKFCTKIENHLLNNISYGPTWNLSHNCNYNGLLTGYSLCSCKSLESP